MAEYTLKNSISLCSDTDADSSSSLSSSSSPPLLSDDDNQQDKNENNSPATKKSEFTKVSVFTVIKHSWVLPRKNYHQATFSKIMNLRGQQKYIVQIEVLYFFDCSYKYLLADSAILNPLINIYFFFENCCFDEVELLVE